MRRFLLAAVISGVAAGAQAADMPDLPILRGGFTEGPAAATVNWQGYYIGGQGSYGTITSKLHSGSNSGLQSAFVPPAWQPSGQQLNGENGGGGAFAGYNSQWDDVVVGIEANYLHGGLRASSSSPGVTVVNNVTAVTNSNLTVQVSDFGSLRVRGAYVIGCFLPYLFGGAGLGSQTVEGSLSAYPPVVAWNADKTKLVYGYSLGFGVDIMLDRGLFARVEYEYLRVTSNFDSNVNSVRAGLGYKF